MKYCSPRASTSALYSRNLAASRRVSNPIIIQSSPTPVVVMVLMIMVYRKRVRSTTTPTAPSMTMTTTTTTTTTSFPSRIQFFPLWTFYGPRRFEFYVENLGWRMNDDRFVLILRLEGKVRGHFCFLSSSSSPRTNLTTTPLPFSSNATNPCGGHDCGESVSWWVGLVTSSSSGSYSSSQTA